MTRLGVHEVDPLLVDLTSTSIASWDEPWDALHEHCGLPAWFGRILSAWNDTLGTAAISAVLDARRSSSSTCGAEECSLRAMKIASLLSK